MNSTQYESFADWEERIKKRAEKIGDNKLEIERYKRIASGEVAASLQEIADARFLLDMIGIPYAIKDMMETVKEQKTALEDKLKNFGNPEDGATTASEVATFLKLKIAALDDPEEKENREKELEELEEEIALLAEKNKKGIYVGIDEQKIIDKYKKESTKFLEDAQNNLETKKQTIEALQKERSRVKETIQTIRAGGKNVVEKAKGVWQKLGLEKDSIFKSVLVNAYIEAGRIDLAFTGRPKALQEYIWRASKSGEDISRWNPEVWKNPLACMSLTVPQWIDFWGKKDTTASWNFNLTLTANPWMLTRGLNPKDWESLGFSKYDNDGNKIDKFPPWAGSAGFGKMCVQVMISVDPKRTLNQMMGHLENAGDREKLREYLAQCITKLDTSNIPNWAADTFNIGLTETAKKVGWKLINKYDAKITPDKISKGFEKKGIKIDKTTLETHDGDLIDPHGNIWTYDRTQEKLVCVWQSPRKQRRKTQMVAQVIDRLDKIIDTNDSFWLCGRFISPSQVGTKENIESLYASGKPELQRNAIGSKKFYFFNTTEEQLDKMEKDVI